MKRFLKKHHRFIIGIILSFMAIVSLLNAWWDSAIFDETAHIGAAYTYVTEQQIRLNPEHPPLLKDLAGLPLLFLNLNFNTNQPFWTGELPRKWDEGQWAAGRNLLYQSGNNPDWIIFWARIPFVILSIILGAFIFFWARKLAGTLAGLLALTLYAFDPNILGHNHFVTTDLGIAAFLTFAFYFFFKFLKDPTRKNIWLGGIFLGLLASVKFSFIIALPVFVMALVIYPLVKTHRQKNLDDLKFKLKALGTYLVKGLMALGIALITIWFVYLLNTFRMPKEIVAESVNFTFSSSQTANAKEFYTNKTLNALNNNFLTRPLAIFGQGIGYVFRRVSGGNGAYFMGQVSSTAFPAYFPTVFLVKEPIPTLILMLLAIFISVARLIKSYRQNIARSFEKAQKIISHFLRTNIIIFSLFIFILLYAYVSVTGNLNIGFRHLFPILPFIYILVAKNIVEFWKKIHPERKFILATVVAFLTVYLIGGTVLAYPNYMSYFNAAAGGPKLGYRLATDSNADWGQDLKRLKSWIEDYNRCFRKPDRKVLCSGISEDILDAENGIQKIRIDYFGGGDIDYYISPYYQKWWDSKRPIEPGWYAISTNFLMGSLYDKSKKDSDSYRWLLKMNKKPVYQVGTSLLIYYVSIADVMHYQE